MEGIKVDGTFDNVVQAAIKMDNQEEMHESMKLKEYGEPRTPTEKIVNFIWRWRWEDISEAYERNDDPSDGIGVIKQALDELFPIEGHKYTDGEINSANDELFKRWLDYNSDAGWRPYEESTMREGMGVFDMDDDGELGVGKVNITHDAIPHEKREYFPTVSRPEDIDEDDVYEDDFGNPITESTLSHERNFEAKNFQEAYKLKEEGYNTLVNRAGEVERFKDPNKPDTTHYDYQEVFSPCHWGEKVKNSLDFQLKAMECELESEKGIRAAIRVYNYYQETVADLKHDGDLNGSNELRGELEKLRKLIVKSPFYKK